MTYGTFAVICQRRATGAWHAIMGLHTSGAAAQFYLEWDDGNVLVVGNASVNSLGTTTFTSTTTWYCIICHKATGTTVPRLHIYNYTTNAWTHEDCASSIANGGSVSGGTMRFGEWAGVDDLNGTLAVAAAWSNSVPLSSDALWEASGLPFTLTAWDALAPTALWVLDQSATGQALGDRTGGGANQSSQAGNTVGTDSVPVFNYGNGPWLVIRPQGGGATIHDLAVSGTLVSTGTLVKIVGKAPSGTLASTGTLVKIVGKAPAGTLASIGALVKIVGKAPAGTLASAGTLVNQFMAALAVGGTLASTGALVKDVTKSLAGTLASTGALVKIVATYPAGALASAGSLAKIVGKTMAGTLASAGDLTTVRSLFITLTGTMASAGSLVKDVTIGRAGTLVSSGSLASTVGKEMAGTLAATGTLSKIVGKAMAGTLTAAGSLTTQLVQVGAVVAGRIEIILRAARVEVVTRPAALVEVVRRAAAWVELITRSRS